MFLQEYRMSILSYKYLRNQRYERRTAIYQLRRISIFAIKYLKSIGFKCNNDLFELHSWYFRNALVRANYRNVAKGINQDYSFLSNFFRNLLMGENHELKNRYMLVNAPTGWTSTEQAPLQVPQQV